MLRLVIQQRVRFFSIVSLGNAADLDFAEIIDHLSTDTVTHCILIYMEGMRNAPMTFS
ncbi:MAG: hypothetical protein IPN64_12125 [Propionivibrio sp.]|nr:hypothetical protein [Propionivibrio sp.]